MLLRDLAYDVEVKYMEGKKMFLADTLSRAFHPTKNVQIQAEFETINATTFLYRLKRNQSPRFVMKLNETNHSKL